MQSRVAFDQRLMDARISDLQDQRDKPDEYNERLWQFIAPVSRRSLRGSSFVQNDGEADTPQFLRSLNVINYRQFGARPPDHNYVFDSLRGVFRYDRQFLMQFRPIMQGRRESTGLGRAAASRTGISPKRLRIPRLRTPLNVPSGEDSEDYHLREEEYDEESDEDDVEREEQQGKQDDAEGPPLFKDLLNSEQGHQQTDLRHGDDDADSGSETLISEAPSSASSSVVGSINSSNAPWSLLSVPPAAYGTVSTAITTAPADEPPPYEDLEFQEYEVLEVSVAVRGNPGDLEERVEEEQNMERGEG